MSQQWQKKKLYQSQKLHQLPRVSVIYELVLFTLWFLIPTEAFPSVICVQNTEALQSELVSVNLGMQTTQGW
jgi:hypothetical protein